MYKSTLTTHISIEIICVLFALSMTENTFANQNINLNCPQNDAAKGYEFKEVVQKPISPAYKEILEKTKNISLKHQGIVVDESSSDDKLN